MPKYYLYVSGRRGPCINGQPWAPNKNVYINYEFTHYAWQKFTSYYRQNKELDAIEDRYCSHKDTYTILRLCETFKINYKELGFKNWTKGDHWITKNYPEFLYLIYKRAPELVDYKKYFLEHGNPFAHVKRALSTLEVNINVNLRMEMIDFYTNIDFQLFFDNYDDKVRDHIAALKADQKKINHLLLVNPYAPGMEEYMKFTPVIERVWPISSVGARHNLKSGDDTIIPYDAFMQRFHEMSCGLFKRSVNPQLSDAQFPWANVIVTGGSVPMMMERDPTYNMMSDIDLFIYGPTADARLKCYDQLLKWFYKPGETFFATEGTSGSVKTIYIVDVPRKFQIVNTPHDNPYTIVKYFDFTHIQWMVTGKNLHQTNDEHKHGQSLNVYGTIGAINAMRTRLTEFDAIQNTKSERVIKALIRGYDIKYDEFINREKLDIDLLLTDKLTIDSVKQNLYTWYLPKSDPSMPPEIFQMNVKGQIKAMSKATEVTTELMTAMQTAAVGTTFMTHYDTTCCTSFSGDTVQHTGVNGWRHQYDLNNRNGQIKLSSPEMTVYSVSSSDEGVTIELEASADFKKFVDILETKVYPRFSPRPLTNKLLTKKTVSKASYRSEAMIQAAALAMVDNNKPADDKPMADSTIEVLKITISKHKIMKQTECKCAVLRDRVGHTLNIEEDLRPGDTITFIFTMSITIDDRRCINLITQNLMKTDLRKIVDVDENIYPVGSSARCTDEQIKKAATISAIPLTYVELDE